MQNSRHIGKGIVLWAVAGVLSVAGIIVYQTVERTFMPVTILLAAGIVVTVIGIAAAVKKAGEPANFAAVIAAVLSAFALVYGFFVMIDPITWVATALEPFSVLYTLIAFEVIMAVAFILNIVAAFTGIAVEEADE